MEEKWSISVRATPLNNDMGKEVAVIFSQKHLIVSNEKPPMPRKGDKPDIDQHVSGPGKWFLLNDKTKIKIPTAGQLSFWVTRGSKTIYSVNGKYDFSAIKDPSRSINWHAEKHMTKTADNLLIRLEKLCLSSARVFVPAKHYKKNVQITPKEKQEETSTQQNENKFETPKKRPSLSLAKSPREPLALVSTPFVPPGKIEVKKEGSGKKPEFSPPPLKRSSSKEGSMGSPSPVLKRSGSLTSPSSTTPSPISRSASDTTLGSGSKDIKLQKSTTMPATPTGKTFIKQIGTPSSTLSSISYPPSSDMDDFISPIKPAAMSPPPIQKSASKLKRSPKLDKPTLMIMKMKQIQETPNKTFHIEDSEEEEEKKLEVIEEIVIPQKYFLDSSSDDEPKKKKKKAKVAKTEDGEPTEMGDKKKKDSEDLKPKKKKKKMEVIDLVELYEKMQANKENAGSSQLNGLAITPKKVSAEKRKDPASDDDDFETVKPITKKSKPTKKEEKKRGSKDDKKAKNEKKPKKEVKKEVKEESDEDEVASGDEMKVDGEGTVMYSLQTFQEQEEDEHSEYEYSVGEIGEGDLISSTPIKSTPPAPVATADGAAPVKPNDEDVDDGHSKEEAVLYSEYVPRVPADTFVPHPANVVEAHTLASVALPDCDYQPTLPGACFKKGGLSSLQLETVQMVGMQHTRNLQDGLTRSGYFIGDGTGVGKGRQIAAIIADNYLKGRKKAIWFSVSSTLSKDARRDMNDIGCGEEDKHYIPLLEMPNKTSDSVGKKGVLFATYSKLVSKGTKGAISRFEQIINWCGEEFEGVIVFDEGHAAKNLRPGVKGSSQTGQRVLDLQTKLPRARIVYVSATGATEPTHMAYMDRLGLWGEGTQFPTFKEFAHEISEAGVGAMEMVAMEMKSRGIYCSRYLSFEGTQFDILKHNLTDTEIAMYNKSVKIWDKILEISNRAANKATRSLVWGAHQRFYLQMILATKIKDCVTLVKSEVASGRAVVIGLFSTGEALVGEKEEKEEEADELFSAPQQILLNLLDKLCTVDSSGNPEPQPELGELVEQIKGMTLPENPLDKLIDELGGVKKVAEMTGRRKRYVKKKGVYHLESRDSKKANWEERDSFQNGEKSIAIISDAASMGISLQSDMSCKNTKQRIHVILQLPWAADKAVQQLGRTHRSHQVTPPHYKLIITDLGGEWRLASTIAARLASLGALTNADRRAATASKSLSKFLLQPKYVLEALHSLENEISGNPECVALYNKYKAMELGAGAVAQKSKRFLNRLLGFVVDQQKKLFDMFMNQYERQVLQALKEGKYDDGVYDLQGELVSGPELVYQNPLNPKQKTNRYVIAIDRGVTWKKAVSFLREADKTKEGTTKTQSGPRNGFYKNIVSGQIILAIQRLDSKFYFHVCKPHLGHQRNYITRTDLKEKYKLIAVKPARRMWENKYEDADGEGKGQRMVHQTILVDSVLPIFSSLVSSLDGDKIQIVRAKCGDKRLVGVHINEDHLPPLLANLRHLDSEIRRVGKRKSLIEYLATRGYVLPTSEPLESLPVGCVGEYLQLSEAQHSIGNGKKRKKEEYKENETVARGSSFSKLPSSSVVNSSLKLEDVANQVMQYIEQREERRKKLINLLEEQVFPDLYYYNPTLCNSYVRRPVEGTTAKSIVETLMATHKSYEPRLNFLRRQLQNVPEGILYADLAQIYIKENPTASSADLHAIISLPKKISHVDWLKMERLVWVPNP